MLSPRVPLALLLSLFAAPALGASTERTDLYGGDPHVVHLDNSTFYPAFVDQPHAWALEFYMDWCGHCQRFAPVWAEVARRAKDWGAVIKVGAVNCARRRNSALCREFGIRGVPNVKLFGPRTQRGAPGFSGIQHDPDRMVGVLVEFVTAVQRRQRPEGWPELSEYSGSVRHLLRGPAPLQALILETPGRSMGRSVQLDLSSQQHLVRVSRTSHPPADLTERPPTLPALVLLRADGSQQIITASPGEDPRALFRTAIRDSIGLKDTPPSSPPAAPTAAPAPTPAPTRAPADRVFLVDMENAIVVALKQEVTSHAVIEGEALDALRYFLRVLVDLFPGRSHLMGSLQQLSRTLSGQERVSGAALERLLRSSSPWWPGLPALQSYQACRGSRPNYRGYSCGLWTLFHTLTAEEMRKAGGDVTGGNATVLPAVHGYVKHFFSCQHCSRHFQEMAAADGLFDVSSPFDSLLWLWRAHNKVNRRIAGDLTEDPLHPKRQFPDQRLCPECVSGGEYGTKEVVAFLMRFYAAENFRGDGLDPAPVANLGDVALSGEQESQTAGQASSTSKEQRPPSSSPAEGHPSARHPSPSRPHSPADNTSSLVPAPAPASSPTADLHGSASILHVRPFRGPLVRDSLPSPAEDLPGSGAVPLPYRAPQRGSESSDSAPPPVKVPGIMRYPSEMAHVLPTVVRAAPGEEVEEEGPVRTQRRVTYARPRVVYRRPRVVYRRPRVVYSRPRVVYSRPRMVAPSHSGSVMPVGGVQRSAQMVRSYQVRGNH